MNILVCLLFKDSILWLHRFMDCIESLLNTKPDSINYHLSIIHGDSKDGTDGELKRRISDFLQKYKSDGLKVKMVELPLPSRLNRIEKLAVLRNACIIMVDIEDYDYVLSIDSDVMFSPEAVSKLVKDAHNDKAGIIAPFIFIEDVEKNGHRFFYDTWVFRIVGVPFTSMYPYLPRGINPDIATRIFEVDSAGSFYICRAEIFSRYGLKYFTEAKMNVNPQLRYESEHVCFCNDIRIKTPYRIFVDPQISVSHINLEMHGMRWH